jgi:beta-galactosidase
MVKALGLNTLSVYIMWNYHEIEKGKFDFETENKNLGLFLNLAEKYGMKVLIRPGPYVCAEWDFGGLPSRLLADPSI